MSQNSNAAQEEQARRLFAHLSRGGRFSYLWTSSDKRSHWYKAGEPPPTPQAAINVYFGVHPVSEIPTTNSRGEPRQPEHVRSQIQHVAVINCLFAEFDAKDFGDSKDLALQHVRGLESQPSVIVDSGGGYHCYWLLSEPFVLNTDTNQERAKELQHRWVGRVGGDPGAKDLARVLRVPGSRNTKPAYAPDFPIVSFVKADFKLVYDLESLAAQLPAQPEIEIRARRSKATVSGRKADKYVEAALQGELEKISMTYEGSHDRNDTLNKAAFAMGTLLHWGPLNRDDVEAELVDAGLSVGLDHSSVVGTVNSGLTGGMRSPRPIPGGNIGRDNEFCGRTVPPTDRHSDASTRTLSVSAEFKDDAELTPDPGADLHQTGVDTDLDQTQSGSCAEPQLHEDLLALYEAALQADADDRPQRLQELASALLGSDPFTVEAFVNRAKEDDLCTKGAFKDALEEARRVLVSSDDDGDDVSQRRPRLTTTEYIDLYLQWGYDVRLNLCTDDLEINGETILDIVAAIINTQVRDYGIVNNVRVSVRHAEEALIVMADRHRYHPVKEYLESLQGDGGQHIAALAAHFKDKDDVFDRWLLHFLVGSVAKIYEGFQNPMLVLDGTQNIGKSYFARWLGSPLPGYLHAGAISPENKDCRLRLNSTWIWEVEELGTTTRKSDVEALKAFLTLKTVRERKAYGRRDIVKPAIASFIGTVNNESGFLVDRTGNRRFLACTITEIDWTYSVAIDINQVWAEALHIYRTDDSWLLGDDEVETRDALNEEYRVDDPIEAYVTSHFIFTGNYDDSVPLTQILDKLSDDGIRPSQRVSIVIASVMRKGGAVKKRESHNGHRQPWYHGVKPGNWGT